MKNYSTLPLAAFVALTAAISTTQAAFVYTETFSAPGDTAGWMPFALADDSSAVQNPGTGKLDFTATNYDLLFLSADQNASLGAFGGSYTASLIDSLSFDLSLGVGSTVTDLFVQLTNFTEDETWQYALTPNAAGTTATFTIPTDLSGAGWTQVSGDQPFSFLLDGVEDFSLVLSGSGDLSGSLDNVAAIAAVPEPSTALFGVVVAAGTLRRRRTVRATE